MSYLERLETQKPVSIRELLKRDSEPLVWETSRGLTGYRMLLNYRDVDTFLEDLLGQDYEDREDKLKIIDLGSGTGLFAQMMYWNKLPAEVFSVNPRLAKLEDWKDFYKTSIHKSLEHLIKRGEITIEELTQLEKYHLKHAVAGDWNYLPFKDKTIDRVICVASFPTYVYHIPDEIENGLKEIIRVLKIGGRAFLATEWSLKEEANKTSILMQLLKINSIRWGRTPGRRLDEVSPSLIIYKDKEVEEEFKGL